METENIKIQYALSEEGEYKIKGVGRVDGFCKETNTVYEFEGRFWHGSPQYFDQNKIHPYSKKNETFGDLYRKTLLRNEKIKSLGFNLIVKWEEKITKSKVKQLDNDIIDEINESKQEIESKVLQEINEQSDNVNKINNQTINKISENIKNPTRGDIRTFFV